MRSLINSQYFIICEPWTLIAVFMRLWTVQKIRGFGELSLWCALFGEAYFKVLHGKCSSYLMYRLMFLMIRLDISHGSFCFCRKFYPPSDSEWEIERINITLRCQDGKTFQCPKLKLIEVIYNHDENHQLIDFLWSLGRSAPDANIKLKKIELFGA